MDGIDLKNKLYGRENEVKLINEAFDRICKGIGEIISVPGISGVGKTSLVYQLQQGVEKSNGFFVVGKFEQYQQNIPYFAFRQLLKEIYLKIDSESGPFSNSFKEKIVEAVNEQGQLLIDLVPEFENILGIQPVLDTISPQEARHRFANVIRNFLKVICQPEHPMVMFIDDWQWADSASCELLKQLNVGNELRYLALIVSYRDNEVKKGSLFLTALDDIQRKHISFTAIPVKNLSLEHVYDFLVDNLKPELSDADKLSAFFHRLTKGNPFFIKSLLFYLFETGALWYDSQSQCWKSKTLEGLSEVPDNVVDLFIRRFGRLPDDMQQLISLAACLGNRFHLEVLSIIGEMDEEQCFNLLSSPQLAEYINLTGYEMQTRERIPKPDTFVFKHDRMQQAAFSLIDKSLLPHLLLKIGRLLKERLPLERRNERLFEIVNALNAGFHLINNTGELIELVALNVVAARKAYSATAYNEALRYYREAKKVINKDNLEEKMWQSQHDLMMDFYKDRAVCEFLEGEQDQGEYCIKIAVENAADPVEVASAYNILIVHYTLMANYTEAISAGKKALEPLGIFLPVTDFDHHRDNEIAKVIELLEGQSVSSLAELVKMNNTEMLMATKILITMGPPCYRSHQKLWSVIVPIVVRLTLEHGNISQVGYSHTAFGGLLAWVSNEYQLARDFSDLATELMTKHFKSPSEQSVFYLMKGSSNTHWFKHMKYGSQDYIDAYNIGLRSGNLQYAAYAFGHNMYNRFFQGISLDSLLQETKQSLLFSKNRHNQWAIDLFEGETSVINMLRNNQSGYSEGDTNYLHHVDQHKNIQVVCIYKILKLYALIILDKDEEALRLSEEIKPILYTVGTQGLLPWPEYVSLRMLAITRNYDKLSDDKLKELQSELVKILLQLKKWTSFSPENFEHKYTLACAESAFVKGNYMTALMCYSKALEAARKEGFIQWEGIINEQLFKFWLRFNNHYIAYRYWQQAYICYRNWGAKAKVQDMEIQYQKFLLNGLPKELVSGNDHDGFSTWFVNNQLELTRKLAEHIKQADLQEKASMQADELAEATKRLRIEISQRKQAEEAIRQKNKELQRINAEKDKFFSIIAHDLKSPFNSVMGLSEVLIDTLERNDFEEAKSYASIIFQSSKNAMELLMNLMEWSMSQTGRMKFSPEAFDLTQLVTETKDLLYFVADQKDVEIKHHLPANLMVNADKAMISTILRNLVSNAIKFSHEGNEILVAAEGYGHEVKVHVKDNGIGISKEMTEKLFRVDEQYSTRGTHNEKGTGLGLALCKEFIEKHNGKIGVESTEGQGSEFWFSLPVS